VVLGYDDFLSVTMEDLLRHTAATVRGAKKSSRPQLSVAKYPVKLRLISTPYPLGQQPEQVGKRGQNGEDREGQQGAQPE
jgi:hypothetical protein